MAVVDGQRRERRRDEHVQMSVRVPSELVSALEHAAADADRTLSAEVRRILRQHVLAQSGREATA